MKKIRDEKKFRPYKFLHIQPSGCTFRRSLHIKSIISVNHCHGVDEVQQFVGVTDFIVIP